MTRPDWLDLCGEWGFAYDDDDLGQDEQWATRSDGFDRAIVVPFPPESPASGINDKYPHRVVWYRRIVQASAGNTQQRWLIHFGAVDYRAKVWVNGQLVAEHEGGNSSFSADITAALRSDSDDQVVVVRAEDDADDLTQPRGKQYWKRDPGEIWYHRTTGIWQPVWLESVPSAYIAGLRWTTDLQRGRIGLRVELNRKPAKSLALRVNLALHGQPFASDEYIVDKLETEREIGFVIPNVDVDRRALYWSPENPNLIDADLTLIDRESGASIDSVGSYLGIRSTAIGAGNFVLNGRPYYLRTALAQGYWPESHLAAPSGEAIRREVELAKELGLNGLRLHQKVEDPRYLYWCDRIGLLVWGEMANAYAFSTRAVERFTREWIDVVRRDVSHPSIVAWVPFNESWGVPNLERDATQRHYVEAIYHLTHSIDPTRPVIGNDGWELFAADIWGIHDYTLDPEVIRERYGSADAVATSLKSVRPYFHALTFPWQERDGQPVMLTEVGGIDYVEGESFDQEAMPRRALDLDDFLSRFGALMDAIFDCETIQGFCYTQLCDTQQELCGFLTADRQPKFDP
ncbi:MAG: glycoside hydrolase family 2 protein, partial [Thermomicrobiales bacterium]